MQTALRKLLDENRQFLLLVPRTQDPAMRQSRLGDHARLIERLDNLPFLDEDARHYQRLSADPRLRVQSINQRPSAYWDVTAQARAVFGDIVRSARALLDVRRDSDLPQLEDSIRDGPPLPKDGLGFSAAGLEITFTNGITVVADAGEWGSIQRRGRG